MEFKDGFELIKEYEHFYLCGKYKRNGELLFRECFSRFEIDGVSKKYDLRKQFRGKYGR